MAHALTGLRLVLAAPFCFWMLGTEGGAPWWAASAIAIAIATDLADGPIARRRGTASPSGRLFDHTSDFLFVSAGLWAMAWRDAIPIWLPALVAFAFAQYLIDSYWLQRQPQLRMSFLGRWNGILYFVPPCGDVLLHTGTLAFLGLGLLAPLIPWIAWLLIASTAASILDRGRGTFVEKSRS